MVTWPHLLRGAGYRVVLDGKMHFIGPDVLHGFERQLTKNSSSQIRTFTKEDTIGEREIAALRQRVEEAGPGHSKNVDHDDTVIAAAIEWLRDEGTRGGPWCLVAGLLTPHFPLIAPQELFERYYTEEIDLPRVPVGEPHPAHDRMRHFFGLEGLTEEQNRRARAAYYALVTYMDGKVGELLAALEHLGLAEDTLVIYTADHGEMAGEHGLWWKNSFYEHSSRIPLIARLPGRFPAARRFAGVASLVDVARTLVDITGAEDPGDMDGDSLMGILEDPGSDEARGRWKDEAFCEYYGPATDRPHRMLRSGRWKYCYYHEEPPELYDLRADPDERVDLSRDPAYAGFVSHLSRRTLSAWDPDAVDRAIKRSARARRLIAAASGL